MDKLLQLALSIFFLYLGIRGVFYNKSESEEAIEERGKAANKIFGGKLLTGKKKNKAIGIERFFTYIFGALCILIGIMGFIGTVIGILHK